MKLAVIDAGVFVAGVFWRHEPRRCLKAWLCGALTPVMSEEIMAEYEAALARVRQEQQFVVNTTLWLDTLRTAALWVEPISFEEKVYRDSKDNKFVEAALAEQDCYTVIARDRDLMSLEKPFGIDILTPREWVAKLTGPQRKRLRG